MNRFILISTLILFRTYGFSQSDMYQYNLACDRKDVIDTVENFMKHVQSSIISGDKNWLASNIKYPIRVSLDGKIPATLKTEQEFVQDFDKIFYKAYVALVKREVARNMLSNAQGVMLGSGEIWINTKPNSKNYKCALWVVGINNDTGMIQMGNNILSQPSH